MYIEENSEETTISDVLDEVWDYLTMDNKKSVNRKHLVMYQMDGTECSEPEKKLEDFKKD